MRWGVGPVFIYECLANSRRWQTYAIRSCAVAALLLAMATIAGSNSIPVNQNAWREYARLGEYYFYAMIGVELAVVMLAAPAATAGAICMDRSRGTLAHILATDLSDPEIVLGKLAARLLPVFGLVACSWPVLAIGSLLGGIDPTALTIAFAIILAVALLGCTVALTLSVWARKPHEVILVAYTVWILILLIWPIWLGLSKGGIVGPPSAWSLVANPFYLAFAPYAVPGRIGLWDYVGFFSVTIGTSVVLTVLAVWRMRPVASRGTSNNRKELRLGWMGRLIRWLPGPRLDGNPVLWREWHRSRPSPWMMGLLVLVGGSTFVACVVGAVTAWVAGINARSGEIGVGAGVFGYILQVLFGFLMLSAVAPMSMSEERQRGSLDLLATTTLSSRSIVLGKWLGTFRLVALLTIGPGLMALALATGHKDPPRVVPGLSPVYSLELSRGELLYGAALVVVSILAHGALLTSVGLALAIWIKRQSRAIAISVCSFVVVAIGWPFLIEICRTRTNNQGLVSLSPIMAVGLFADALTIRNIRFRELLVWTSFWDLEVAVLAVGLLWLTLATFDRCLGRIPERPRRTSLLTDFVVVLAGLVGTGGLFGSIAIWVKGITLPELSLDVSFGIWCSSLIVTTGFLLVSGMTIWSISGERIDRFSTARGMNPDSPRRFVLGKWRAALGPVALLAIGPGLIALALATTHKQVILTSAQQTPLPDGGQVVTWTDATGALVVATIDSAGKRIERMGTPEEVAALNAPAPGEPMLSDRSSLAVMTVFTILAHGAFMASLGLALGAGIRSRSRALVTGGGLFLMMAVAWPIFAYIVFGDVLEEQHFGQGLMLLSPVFAIGFLLKQLGMRSDTWREILVWAQIWDFALIVATFGLLWQTVRTVKRRLGRAYPADDADRAESQGTQPARDGVLVAD